MRGSRPKVVCVALLALALAACSEDADKTVGTLGGCGTSCEQPADPPIQPSCSVAASCGCMSGCEPLTGSGAPAEPAVIEREHIGPALVDERGFRLWDGAGYRRVFLKGVALGTGVPGKHPGELAPSYEQYRRWFGQMQDIGLNTVRVYTLHFPRFYQALRDHNRAHPERPLYVLQGVWLSEPEGATRDLHEQGDGFRRSIEEVIDAVHGSLDIPERKGRGWGQYDAAISEWVVGYIIGREVFAEEVKKTDEARPGETSFAGQHFALAQGNPSAVWAAQQLEHAVAYERRRYQAAHPVAFSNWSELDPLEHPTEADETKTDIAELDLVDLEVKDAPAGHFISYHVYPYWPLFVSEDPTYRQCSDALGPNSYLAFARDLKAHHKRKALLAGEFGVPSSLGIAKFSYSGMHHGGHTEAEQGTYGARMLENLFCSGYAGAMYFHWMDGWFKRIWITDRRVFPPDRLPLWHDMTNPQQHYGLVAFDLGAPALSRVSTNPQTSELGEIQVAADAEFFHVEISLARGLAETEPLLLGIDTYGDDLGESKLPDGTSTRRRNEFALTISGGEARLQVTAAYDVFGYERRPSSGTSELPPLASVPSDGKGWGDVRWQNSLAHESDDGKYQFEATEQPIGRLRVVRAESYRDTHDAVAVGARVVRVRLPWTLLNFSDPSTLSVLDDDPATDSLDAEITKGIALTLVLRGEQLETERFAWEPWNKAPATTERMKASVPLYQKAVQSIPSTNAP